MTPLGWATLGRPEPQRPEDPAARQADDEALPDEAGDLKVLVDQVRRAAAGLRIPAQPSPWLPPLPRTLLLRDLPGLDRQPRPGQAPVPFGRTDLPDRQRQRPAAIGLEPFGHLMAADAPRSGRSQLLRTTTLAEAGGGTLTDARRARRGCLTAPQTLPEGELIGTRLSHADLGHPVRRFRGRERLNPPTSACFRSRAPGPVSGQ